MSMPAKTISASPRETELPVVARLYTTGIGRRYRRASTQPGPGEALCTVSSAEAAVRAAVSREKAQLVALVQAEVAELSALGLSAHAEAVGKIIMRMASTGG